MSGDEDELHSDPFLRRIVLEKARSDARVAAAVQSHKRELEQKFAADVQLKARLSEFARQNGLDAALTALWAEIKNYPAWSTRADFDELNKLCLSEVDGKRNKHIEEVSFTNEARRYAVSCRAWHSEEGEMYAAFSFFEDGDEVFAINCSHKYDGYTDYYKCFDVSAFKRRGNWAKALLLWFAQIRVEREKRSVEFGYHGADSIKSRFKE